MFWSFFHVFMFCDFGENLSNGFDALNSEICNRNWYSFPIEIQRLLPIILVSTQKPVQLLGFGNIPCTRETFKVVIYSSNFKIFLSNVFR